MAMPGGPQLMLYLHCGISLVLCFSSRMSMHGKVEFDEDEDGNGTSLFDLLKGNPLHEVSGYWVFNESDISKYEDVDLQKLFQLPGMKGNAIDSPTTSSTRATTRRTTTTPPPTTISPSQMPVFDTDVITNVSAPLGGTAFLHCKVRYLTARTVSWVRRRDWHILSSGLMTYTNDDRFAVLHADNSEDWHLQIKFVQKRDNGTYECQVSTGVGTISHYYHLHVVTPKAYIEGNGEHHIGEGSTIHLVCIVENSPSPPQYVFWYHNERMINYDTERGGVEVSTEVIGDNTHSTLTVSHATSADTGNYTCRAPNTATDTIYVYVSKEGDNTAAIQRLETSSSGVQSATLLTACLMFHCAFLR